MFKRKDSKTSANKINVATSDTQALIQAIRIKIWQIIARNNGEDVIEPFITRPNEPLPYLTKAQEAEQLDDVSSIKPTLDEVLPLPTPKKDTAEPPAPPQKPKKTSVIEIMTDDVPDEQITMDEAIEQAEREEQSERGPAPQNVATEQTQETEATTSSAEQSEEAAQDETEQELTPKERFYAWRRKFLEDYREWKQERAEKKDYFAARKLQIENKNAACFELLEFLTELESEM